MNCVSCRAEIEPADRFCPACRLPNLECTRIPRFGPPETEPGPMIAPRLRGPGQRRCPRCAAGIRRSDRYCRSCGLDSSLLPPAPLEPAPGQDRSKDGPPPVVYRSLEPATVALRLVIASIALTGVGFVALSLVVWRRLGGEVTMVSLPETSIAWSVLQAWVQGLAVVQIVLLAVAAFVMIRWTAQASANMAFLRIDGHTIAPTWASLGWLVPGVNLVLPRQVMSELWRTAEPTGAVDTSRWRRRSCPTTLNLWWICTLVALPNLLAAGVALVQVAGFPPPANADLHAVRNAFTLLAAAEALLIFAAGLFARVVGEVTERQDRRVAWLNRGSEPREEPAPKREATRPDQPRRSGRAPRAAASAVEVPPEDGHPEGLVHIGGDGSPIGKY